jgi:hypothetical protein
MTSSSAPLDAQEKKKSNPILRWVFRFVMFLVVIFVLALVAMNVLNGTGSVQKSSIEGIIGDVFKGKGHIKNLQQFSALPYVTLEIEESVVVDAENEKKLLMTADYFAFHTGLINIILKRPIFRRIEISNFFAAPGTLAEKAVIIDHVKPIEGTNTLSVKGQYSKLPFSFIAEMQPLYEGADLTYGFKLAEKSKVEGTIGDINFSFHASNAGNGLLFDDLTLQRSGKTLARGSVQIAHGLSIIADLVVNKADIHAKLHYDAAVKDGKTNIKGELRVKSLDLSTIGSEDDTIKALQDAVQSVIALINAPIAPAYRNKNTKESSATLFSGLNIDIDVHFKNVQMKGAHLGDIHIPVKIMDDALKLSPISGEINGGKLGGKLALFENKNAEFIYSHDLTLSQWDFGQFLTDTKANHSDVKGKANFKSALTSNAPALDKIINSAQGDFNFVIADAEMKSSIADKLMSGLISAIMPSLEDSSMSQINCAIGHFTIKDGIANADTLFADMKRVQLVADGDIDLVKQQYDLKITPEAKRTTLLDITPSVRMKGPLNAPKVSPDALSLGTKLGGALLGVVNPVFLAASLTDFGLGKNHSCSEFTTEKNASDKKDNAAKEATAPMTDNKE